ncbi:MAG: hypothetical protein ACTJHT_06530 [Sphingobacterium sp.]|uniref:hypothetical protein n=1 Tax=Sphingobacterium sp. JB170 TaxID=1434842 RepID=UPI00097E9CBE|nr:hypothetical protein [Sphingobacterium sp. JB170]SJN32520.1 hypothetical protein FM107_07395 [Sphingobacterium sp. JB170]
MNKILFALALIILLVSSSNAQQEQTSKDDVLIVKAFLNDIAVPETRADVILAKHVQIEKSLTNEEYDYLEASIDEIRLNLQTKNIETIDYVPFDKLSRRDKRDIDPEGKPTSKMYFLYYNDRLMLAVYLENGKIGSFTLVSKGNNLAHFVTY